MCGPPPPPIPPSLTLHPHPQSSCCPRVSLGGLPRMRLFPWGGLPEGTPTHPHLTQHFHHHTSRRHSQTPGFPRERFFPPGGDGGAHPSNLKPCFISPTYLSDSPLVEQDTCCLPYGSRRRHRSCHDGAHDPLCHRQHRLAAGVALLPSWACWRAPWVLPPRGAWALGLHNHLILTTPHHTIATASITPPHTTHALMTPGPSRRGGQALLDHHDGIPQPHLIP